MVKPPLPTGRPREWLTIADKDANYLLTLPYAGLGVKQWNSEAVEIVIEEDGKTDQALMQYNGIQGFFSLGSAVRGGIIVRQVVGHKAVRWTCYEPTEVILLD